MKLAKIDITYFRCFESLSVKLHPDINVFVGANGAGKSSILDAIAIALYEIVAANGGGGKSQRKMQGATLQDTDIFIDPSKSYGASWDENTDSYAIIGRKSFVQIRAMASDYYFIDDNSLKPLLDEESVLEWTEHITYRPPTSLIRYKYIRKSIRTSPIYNASLGGNPQKSASADSFARCCVLPCNQKDGGNA